MVMGCPFSPGILTLVFGSSDESGGGAGCDNIIDLSKWGNGRRNDDVCDDEPGVLRFTRESRRRCAVASI